MLLKKVTYSWRNWKLMLFVQILLPLVIIMLSLTFFDFKLKKMENVPLELTLKTYGQTVVPFFVSENFHLDPQLSDNFKKMLEAAGQIPLHLKGRYQDQGAEREVGLFFFSGKLRFWTTWCTL